MIQRASLYGSMYEARRMIRLIELIETMPKLGYSLQVALKELVDDIEVFLITNPKIISVKIIIRQIYPIGLTKLRNLLTSSGSIAGLISGKISNSSSSINFGISSIKNIKTTVNKSAKK